MSVHRASLYVIIVAGGVDRIATVMHSLSALNRQVCVSFNSPREKKGFRSVWVEIGFIGKGKGKDKRDLYSAL